MTSISHAGGSHPGRLHAQNEDRWLADAAARLYLIADGMANAIAPQIVIDHLPEMLRQAGISAQEDGDPALASRLGRALTELSGRIRAACSGDSEFGGLGTTLVMVLASGTTAFVAHVGDSRAYLYRDHVLTPLTRDQSLLQLLQDRGEVTPEEAACCHWNGGPTRFLGMPGPIEPDVKTLPLQPGDRLLLCSDGLTEMLSDAEVLAILDQGTGPEETCQQLIDAANEAGGRDNITALVIQFH